MALGSALRCQRVHALLEPLQHVQVQHNRAWHRSQLDHGRPGRQVDREAQECEGVHAIGAVFCRVPDRRRGQRDHEALGYRVTGSPILQCQQVQVGADRVHQ